MGRTKTKETVRVGMSLSSSHIALLAELADYLSGGNRTRAVEDSIYCTLHGVAPAVLARLEIEGDKQMLAHIAHCRKQASKNPTLSSAALVKEQTAAAHSMRGFVGKSTRKKKGEGDAKQTHNT